VTINLISSCFGRHYEPLVPAAFAVVSTNQFALSPCGYGPFSLCIIHKEGLRPSSEDISWWWLNCRREAIHRRNDAQELTLTVWPASGPSCMVTVQESVSCTFSINYRQMNKKYFKNCFIHTYHEELDGLAVSAFQRAIAEVKQHWSDGWWVRWVTENLLSRASEGVCIR
jgi:hypothetical protein